MPIPIEHVKRFVHEHLHKIRGPRDVAEHLGYRYNSLRKDFKHQEDITLGDFILKTRVEQAKRLLVETDLLCFEIADAVGFSREDVAARAFKRETNLSMREYRKRHLRTGVRNTDNSSRSQFRAMSAKKYSWWNP